MTSALVDHDHDVFTREEPGHVVVQTSVQLVVLRRLNDGLHDPHKLVVVCFRYQFIIRSPEFVTALCLVSTRKATQNSHVHSSRQQA